jgi:hypothetical protein
MSTIETDRFFALSGVHLAQHNRGGFHYHRSAFSRQIKTKTDSNLVKASVLRLISHPSHLGPGAHLCTLLEVWVLGVGMSTLAEQTTLYVEDRGFCLVPVTLDHGNIVGTQCCDTLSHTS